ncbi:MAG: CIA30 family protein, partial [SAR86 cluster bacterium]|nr:CIA30 family protein [SAR86 cluster bacterium]
MNIFSQQLNDPDTWRGVTDQVMGGVSNLIIRHSDGVFFMSGNVSTDNNGGFVRLSNRVDISSNDFKGIKFKAKGNNETYEIHVTLKGLKIPPWSYFSQSFNVTEQWQEYQISFKDLKRSSGFSAASMKAKNIRDLSIAGFG